MKLGNSIEYDKRYFSPKIHEENEAGRLVPDLFFFLKKKKKEALHVVKGSGLQISFNMSR